MLENYVCVRLAPHVTVLLIITIPYYVPQSVSSLYFMLLE